MPLGEFRVGSGMRLSGLVLALAAGAAIAGPEVSSPLSPTGVDPSGAGTALSYDLSAYAALRPLTSVTMTNFALTGDRSVTLELERFEVFSPGAQIVAVDDQGIERPVARPDVVLLRGEVQNLAGSRAYLALSPLGVNGYVTTKNETWIVSSGPRGHDGAPVIYDLASLPEGIINWADITCDADSLPLPDAPHGEVSGRGGPCRSVDIAIETDVEFLGLFGGNQTAATTYVATLFGGANDIYIRDVNTRLTMPYLRFWAAGSDPWTGTSTSAQLDQFVNYWNANQGAVTRDLAHFLSGRGLGGGIAYLDAICADTFGYGLSANLAGFFPYPLQDHHAQNWDIIVFTHEIGHNFGAPHTHDLAPPIDQCASGGTGCNNANQGTIMSYCHLCAGGIANINLIFHSRNINENMLPFLDSLACDVLCPAGINFAFPDGFPSAIDPGTGTDVRVDLINNGVQPNPAHARVLWTIDGGSEQSALMTHLGGQQYLAHLPPGECGDLVSFGFSASGDGIVFDVYPLVGVRPQAVTQSSENVTFTDNGETSTGWTSAATATDGQWSRGVPVNCDRGDPPSDYDGSGACWLTDNAAQADCNTDVDGGTVTLVSPALDTSGDGIAFITYARWYSNNFGGSPNADVFTVQVGTGTAGPWTTVEVVGPTGVEAGGGWYEHAFRVSDFVTPSANTRLRFIADDAGTGSVIEAGVDALQVSYIVCDSACPADLSGASDPNDPAYGVPDGSADSSDFFYYLDQFVASNLAVADLTGSSDPNDPTYGVPNGAIDAADFFYFLDIFVEGCP
jgi:hypothetical protein